MNDIMVVKPQDSINAANLDFNLNIATINLNGNWKAKKDLVVDKMEKLDLDILFICHTGINRKTTRTSKLYAFNKIDVVTGDFFEAQGQWPEQSAMAVLWKKNLDAHIITSRVEDRIVQITVHDNKNKINILGIYAPPDRESRRKWAECIPRIIQASTPMICLGDFNEFNNETTDYWRNAARKNNHMRPIFMEKLMELDYVDTYAILNENTNKFTFFKTNTKKKTIMKSRIDHILMHANHVENRLIDTQIEEENLFDSDHRMVKMNIRSSIGERLPQIRNTTPQTQLRNLPRKLWEENFAKNLSDIAYDMTDSDDIELIADVLTNKIQAAIKETCPETENKFNNKPRKISCKESKLKKDKKFLSELFRLIGDEYEVDILQRDEEHLHKMCVRYDVKYTENAIRETINKCRQKISNKYKKIKLRNLQKHINKKIEETIGRVDIDNNQVYKLLFPNNNVNKISAARRTDHSITVNEEEVKDAVKSKWEPVFKSCESVEERAFNHNTPPIGLEILKKIEMKELDEVIRNLKKNKAAGDSNIPNEALQHLPEEQKETFLHLMNEIIRQNHVPQIWRDASVTLIYKDGEKTDPLNYRPIALLNTMYKVFSHIINARLTATCTEHKLIHKDQYGFCKGKSTTQAAIEHIACIEDALLSNRDLHCIYRFQKSVRFRRTHVADECNEKIQL
jgi:exonuclease III